MPWLRSARELGFNVLAEDLHVVHHQVWPGEHARIEPLQHRGASAAQHLVSVIDIATAKRFNCRNSRYSFKCLSDGDQLVVGLRGQ